MRSNEVHIHKEINFTTAFIMCRRRGGTIIRASALQLVGLIQALSSITS